MGSYRYATCGHEHELTDLEPSYDRPDAYFQVPPEEREHCTSFGKSDGRIRDAEDTKRRHFLRVVLPAPVRGESSACNWGVWVEISASAWRRVHERWDDPDQGDEPPFHGELANALKGYDTTAGLPGVVQLTGPTTVPEFHLDPSLDHLLARDQREGVYA
jgi:hypothetical protein